MLRERKVCLAPKARFLSSPSWFVVLASRSWCSIVMVVAVVACLRWTGQVARAWSLVCSSVLASVPASVAVPSAVRLLAWTRALLGLLQLARW